MVSNKSIVHVNLFETESRIRLKSTLYVAGHKEGLVFSFSPDEVFLFQLDRQFKRRLIELLDGKITVGEIYERLTHEGYALLFSDLLQCLDEMSKALLLEQWPWELPSSELERYDRQIRFFGAGDLRGISYGVNVQKRLTDSKVTLLGIGGFGSHILWSLAAMGIGNIKVVDFDRVEKSNLSRQCLYKTADIGLSKVDTALKYIREQNPQINIEGIEKKITSVENISSLISGSDIVHGVLAPFVSTAASLMSLEVVRYLGKFENCTLPGRIMFFNLRTMTPYFQKGKKKLDCPLCREQKRSIKFS